MSKISADTQILDWFRKKQKLTIEGNKEYYITLEYSNAKYIYRFGDSLANQDTEVKEMPDYEVLEYLKAHYIRKAKSLHKKEIRKPEDVWNYIQENPYI
jgi:hypothetical protein